MLVIGAKGLAKEILEVLQKNNQTNDLYFYDDLNEDIGDMFFDRFPIIKNTSSASSLFNNKFPEFTIGIGKPKLRKLIHEKFTMLGGKFTSVISDYAEIGSFDVSIGNGCNILPNAIVSNGVSLGLGCLLYYNTIITHDCKVGNFVELSPGATLLGRVVVGNNSHIGANATILPDIKIGANVTVGAGAVVTKDLPNNCVAVGVPAKIYKF